MAVTAMNLFFGIAAAETYPTKPIQIIVPFATGGGVDVVARLIAPKLSERLGKPVIAMNQAGAGGTIGTEKVANAKPDGYTLLLTSATHTMTASLYNLRYDPIHSFAPIQLLATGSGALTVHPSVPVHSVKELIHLAKQKPGELLCASARGAFPHFGAELFRNMAGIDYRLVQFKSGGPALIDHLGGHSQILYVTLMQVSPHIKSGQLRALGTGGSKRSVLLPVVPTIAEAGVPGFEAINWWGMMAPARTPAPIVERLDKELKAILDSPEMQKIFLTQGGAEVTPMGPADFSRLIATELTKWARVAKESNIKPED
jgi:tripartite-type tricarboxylate transporter receptor subunit TctC